MSQADTTAVTSVVVLSAVADSPAVRLPALCCTLLTQLREKLNELHAENNLLGTLVKELKVCVAIVLGCLFACTGVCMSAVYTGVPTLTLLREQAVFGSIN